MTDITPTASDTADLEARNQSTAGRLFVAADAFLFLGFLFAYLYLRTLNNNGLWNPPGQNPSGTMGAVVLVLVLVTAALIHVGSSRMAASGPAAFRAPAAAALAVSLVAMVLVASQLFRPGFSPTHAGGFGSVFVGFIAFYFVHVVGGVYWLETQVVQRPGEILRASVPPCLLYWWFLAVVLAIFSVLFYLVQMALEPCMHLIALAMNDNDAGGWMTLVIPVGFLAIVLACGWAMRHRVP